MVVIFAALPVVFLSGGILVLIPVLDGHQPGRIQALQFGAVVVHRPQLGPGGDGGDGLAVYHRRGHAVVLILTGATVNGNADVQLVGGSALGIVLPVHQLPGGVFHAGLFFVSTSYHWKLSSSPARLTAVPENLPRLTYGLLGSVSSASSYDTFLVMDLGWTAKNTGFSGS